MDCVAANVIGAVIGVEFAIVVADDVVVGVAAEVLDVAFAVGVATVNWLPVMTSTSLPVVIEPIPITTGPERSAFTLSASANFPG